MTSKWYSNKLRLNCLNQWDATYLEDFTATVPHGSDHGINCREIEIACFIPWEGLRVWIIAGTLSGGDKGEKWLFFRDDLDNSAIR
jgi:hypothetical protein